MLTLPHFLAKMNFLEGMEVYIILVEFWEGWRGGDFYVEKMEMSRGEGSYMKFPPCQGMNIFGNYTSNLQTT